MSSRLAGWPGTILALAIVWMLASEPVSADNCGSLSDCYGVIAVAALAVAAIALAAVFLPALIELAIAGELFADAAAAGLAEGAAEAVAEAAGEAAVEAAAEGAAEAAAEGAAEAAAEGAAEAATEGAAETAAEGAAESGAEAATQRTGNILDGLRPGRNTPNLEVDTPEQLEGVFRQLSEGGQPFQSNYPGNMVRLQDGTRVGLRPVSRSGGPTIDVFKADGSYIKIHLP